jgi:threonine/homoserine/homoserine lactone efflux protein
VTTKDAPGAGRTMWRVLLTLAIVVAAASIALVILESQLIGSYFTVFGMACLIWLSVANLRRLKR